jgi:hypothetical protein
VPLLVSTQQSQNDMKGGAMTRASSKRGDVFARTMSHFPLKPISNVSGFIGQSRSKQAE